MKHLALQIFDFIICWRVLLASKLDTTDINETYIKIIFETPWLLKNEYCTCMC